MSRNRQHKDGERDAREHAPEMPVVAEGICPICGGKGEVVVIDEEVGCQVPMPCWSCQVQRRPLATP